MTWRRKEANGVGEGAYLFHPEREGALPGVLLLQVEVGVEEDEIDVALQVLEALQQQRLALRLRLSAFDLKKEQRQPLRLRKNTLRLEP